MYKYFRPPILQTVGFGKSRESHPNHYLDWCTDSTGIGKQNFADVRAKSISVSRYVKIF